jgi:hypothetical protein
VTLASTALRHTVSAAVFVIAVGVNRRFQNLIRPEPHTSPLMRIRQYNPNTDDPL